MSIFTTKPNINFYFLLLLFLFNSSTLFSQNDPSLHNEVRMDQYIPDLRDIAEKSPGYRFSSDVITTVQVNVNGAGMNIVGDAANEPSIAIDPTNPNRMVIGWRQFNSVTSAFRQAGWAYTTNGGESWTFPGVIEPGVFRSDPVLEADAQRNFYYNSLSSNPDFMCHVFKSTDGGATWSPGVFAQGGDKQWMTIDQTNGATSGNIYAFWTSAFSICPPGSFTRSTDNGVTFEDCITIPNDPFWGTLAVGPDGELYLGGSIGSNFAVVKSLNPGAGGTLTWDLATIVNLGGQIVFGLTPNPGGLLGQANISVDTSGGEHHGNVYLLCTVSRNTVNDPADVMFARSTDGGVTWSPPVRINDDTGTSAFQWFGTMSVSPTGRIDVVWLDTRDNLPNTSALYYSNSKDGGLTWSENVKVSEYFNSHLGWPNQNKMGDYFDMISDSAGAFLAWAATFNNEQDVYFSRIIDTSKVVPVELASFSSSVSGNTVTLNWETKSELNNYGFEIERSEQQTKRKTNWRLVGFREGKGTTTEEQKYSFIDKNVPAGKYYYRLKQIDFNGRFEYSDIIEVIVAPEDFALLQNYPNPFNPVTNISFVISHQSLVSLKVYDVLGNEVSTLVNEVKPAGKYEVVFNAEELASGIYYYQLQAGTFCETKKMMILK